MVLSIYGLMFTLLYGVDEPGQSAPALKAAAPCSIHFCRYTWVWDDWFYNRQQGKSNLYADLVCISTDRRTSVLEYTGSQHATAREHMEPAIARQALGKSAWINRSSAVRLTAHPALCTFTLARQGS